jgi:hypothetical protein
VEVAGPGTVVVTTEVVVVGDVVVDVEVTVVGDDVVTVVTDVWVTTVVAVPGSAGGGGRSGGWPTAARAGAALRVSISRAALKRAPRRHPASNTVAPVETIRLIAPECSQSTCTVYRLSLVIDRQLDQPIGGSGGCGGGT